MNADSIFDQNAFGSAAEAALFPEAVEMVTAPASQPVRANLFAYLRDHFGSIRGRADGTSTSEFSSHGL